MRITSKGQVTIPIEIRERLGMHPGTEVDVTVQGAAVRVTRATAGGSQGNRVVEPLRGRARTGLSTNEIMALTRE